MRVWRNSGGREFPADSMVAARMIAKFVEFCESATVDELE